MIQTNRNIMVGTHVTKELRNEIAKRAAKEGTSISYFLYKSLLKLFGLKDNEKGRLAK